MGHCVIRLISRTSELHCITHVTIIDHVIDNDTNNASGQGRRNGVGIGHALPIIISGSVFTSGCVREGEEEKKKEKKNYAILHPSSGIMIKKEHKHFFF
jgi:hypothetical protein